MSILNMARTNGAWLLFSKKLKSLSWAWTWWVTSNGIITKGIFSLSFSTSLYAYGSKKMLNYAAGDIFPCPIAPPIITIF